MNENNELILKLISEDKSLIDIAKILNLSTKQIFQKIKYLKTLGYNIHEKYYSDGTIKYKLKRKVVVPTNEAYIHTWEEETNFRALVISDTHFGNNKDALFAIEMLYDYCINEDIHIILNTGDFADGTFGRGIKNIKDAKEQIDYIIQNYPYDPNIINFITLGDHDYSLLDMEGIDLAIALKNARTDMVPIGYRIGNINIKNDSIGLFHQAPLRCIPNINDSFKNEKIIFRGHWHHLCINQMHNKIIVDVPSLSLLAKKDTSFLPNALVIDVTFREGLFEFISIKHLMIGNNIYTPSETILKVREDKDFKNKTYVKKNV